MCARPPRPPAHSFPRYQTSLRISKVPPPRYCIPRPFPRFLTHPLPSVPRASPPLAISGIPPPRYLRRGRRAHQPIPTEDSDEDDTSSSSDDAERARRGGAGASQGPLIPAIYKSSTGGAVNVGKGPRPCPSYRPYAPPFTHRTPTEVSSLAGFVELIVRLRREKGRSNMPSLPLPYTLLPSLRRSPRRCFLPRRPRRAHRAFGAGDSRCRMPTPLPLPLPHPVLPSPTPLPFPRRPSRRGLVPCWARRAHRDFGERQLTPFAYPSLLPSPPSLSLITHSYPYPSGVPLGEVSSLARLVELITHPFGAKESQSRLPTLLPFPPPPPFLSLPTPSTRA